MDIHNQERRRTVFNSPSTENMLLHELLQEILRVHFTGDAQLPPRELTLSFHDHVLDLTERSFESRYLKLTWIHGQFPKSQVGANHDTEDRRHVTVCSRIFKRDYIRNEKYSSHRRTYSVKGGTMYEIQM